jgi:hypothetical protein
MTRRIATFVSVALVGVAVAVGATPISARAADQGPLRNKNNTGMCIGINGGSKLEWTTANLFRCDGRPNQTYTFEPTSGGYFLIRAQHSGQCLTGWSGWPNIVNQVPCHRGDLFENFRMQNVGGGFFNLVRHRPAGIHPWMCMGVSGGAPVPGAPIGMFECDGKGNQQWSR